MNERVKEPTNECVIALKR